MDLDGLTFACATSADARVARRLGARAAVIGVGARKPLPEGRLVSFGLAGALSADVGLGEVLDVTRVVDQAGNTLWEGGPLGISGARPATILALDRVVDDPAERRRLRELTRADAVDMESGVLARSGRLAGCLRAVSDTPTRTLGPLAHALSPDGRVAWSGVARSLAHPRRSGRALSGVRHALRNLETLQQLVTRSGVAA